MKDALEHLPAKVPSDHFGECDPLLFHQIEQESTSDAKVLKLVQTEYGRKKNRLKCRLEELFGQVTKECHFNQEMIMNSRQALIFDTCTLRVNKEIGGVVGHMHYSNPTTLDDILGGLHAIGELQVPHCS